MQLNEAEGIVLQVWREVLASDDVGLADNFFESGADSLQFVEMVYLLEEAVGEPLEIERFADCQDGREFAVLLQELAATTTASSDD